MKKKVLIQDPPPLERNQEEVETPNEMAENNRAAGFNHQGEVDGKIPQIVQIGTTKSPTGIEIIIPTNGEEMEEEKTVAQSLKVRETVDETASKAVHQILKFIWRVPLDVEEDVTKNNSIIPTFCKQYQFSETIS